MYYYDINIIYLSTFYSHLSGNVHMFDVQLSECHSLVVIVTCVGEHLC